MHACDLHSKQNKKLDIQLKNAIYKVYIYIYITLATMMYKR